MRLGIQTKLTAMLAGIIVIFIAILILAYVYINSLHGIADLSGELFLEFSAVSKLSLHGVLLLAPVHDYLITDERRLETRRFNGHLAVVNKQLRIISRLRIIMPEEKRIIRSMRQRLRTITSLSRRILATDDALDEPRALAMMRRADREQIRLAGLLDRLQKIDEREVRTSLLHAHAVHSAQRNIIFGFAVALGAAVLFSLAVRAYVTRPIIDFYRGVEYISAGNLDYRLDIKTGDEIEDLANAFNRLVAGVHDEQRQAAEIQRHLLPDETLDVRGLRLHARLVQSGEVGGDWYDFYRADERVHFTVGDASGIGLPAALVATLAMTAMRLATGTPVDIVKRANEVIEARLGRVGNFATVLFCQFNPSDRTVNCISCGHEWPLVYEAARQTWSSRECTPTLPLGISSALFDPKINSFKLSPGDKLIAFTDGLRDARDADGNFFEMHSILASLQEHQHLGITDLVEALLNDVSRFSAGRLRDDIAVLGLEMV